MSVEAVAYVWMQQTASPLAKLVLIKFADNGDGTGVIDADQHAEFCCCTGDEIAEAVASLIEGGALAHVAPCTYTLFGYSPRSERLPGARGFQKRAISRRVRLNVFERDHFRCVHCGTSDDLTVDHIHPESKGGSLDFDNLQTLCRPCNSRKGARHE